MEVIYVCPVEVNDEVYQYYSKLLAMKARPQSASAEEGNGDEEDIENRYKIVVPDAARSFPVSISRPTFLQESSWKARLFGDFKNVIRQCRVVQRLVNFNLG